MTTVFGSAIPCSRAARFGVSPTMPLLPRLARSDEVADNHKPSGDTDARLKESGVVQRTYGRDQLLARPNGTLGIVFMSFGVPEIHEHAVAHIIGDEPAEALHRLRDTLLIGRNNLAEVFRIHARRQRRRTDQVREHHRHLAAFGRVFSAGQWVQCSRW